MSASAVFHAWILLQSLGTAIDGTAFERMQRSADLFRRLLNVIGAGRWRPFVAALLIDRWRGVMRRRHGWTHV